MHLLHCCLLPTGQLLERPRTTGRSCFSLCLRCCQGVRLQVAFDAWEETKRWTASLAPEAWQEQTLVNDNSLTKHGMFGHVVSLQQPRVRHVTDSCACRKKENSNSDSTRSKEHPIDCLAEKSTAAEAAEIA